MYAFYFVIPFSALLLSVAIWPRLMDVFVHIASLDRRRVRIADRGPHPMADHFAAATEQSAPTAGVDVAAKSVVRHPVSRTTTTSTAPMATSTVSPTTTTKWTASKLQTPTPTPIRTAAKPLEPATSTTALTTLTTTTTTTKQQTAKVQVPALPPTRPVAKPPEPAWLQKCRQFEHNSPWNQSHPTKRSIAIILRGESFRAPVPKLFNKSKYFHNPNEPFTQFGTYKRLSCIDGSYKLQQQRSERSAQMVEHFESLGFIAHLYGVSYECVAIANVTYTVREELPQLFRGKLRELRLLDKSKSMQITGIQEGVRMLTEYIYKQGYSYDYVLVGRLDILYFHDRWSCLFNERKEIIGDFQTLEQNGNTDVMFFVSRAHVPCYIEYVLENPQSQRPCCINKCYLACHKCAEWFYEHWSGQKFVPISHQRYDCDGHGGRARGRTLSGRPVDFFDDREAANPDMEDMMDYLDARGLGDQVRSKQMSNPGWLPEFDKNCVTQLNAGRIRR